MIFSKLIPASRKGMRHFIDVLICTTLLFGVFGGISTGLLLTQQHVALQPTTQVQQIGPKMPASATKCPYRSSPNEQTRSIDLSTLAGQYKFVVFSAQAYRFIGLASPDTGATSLSPTVGILPTTAIPDPEGAAPYAFMEITDGTCGIVDYPTAQRFLKSALAQDNHQYTVATWDIRFCTDKTVLCFSQADLEYSETDIVTLEPNQVELFFGTFVLDGNYGNDLHGLLLVGAGFNEHFVELWHLGIYSLPRIYAPPQEQQLKGDFCGALHAPYFPQNGDKLSFDVPDWASNLQCPAA